ncbi:MAG: ATP-binding cassette domain-containing protein [Planctomycetota bacterium]
MTSDYTLDVELEQLRLGVGDPPIALTRPISTVWRDGEYTAIAGPSGCGKTTLLLSIAGLARPISGRVLLNDRPVSTVESHQRGISMVFQEESLYPHMKVERLLRTGAIDVEGLPGRLEWLVEHLGLASLMNRRPGQLSGGQRRRVAVAKCLASGKPIRLLDEPLRALDDDSMVMTRDCLRRFHDENRGITIHVTHDVTAAKLADRTIDFSQWTCDDAI